MRLPQSKIIELEHVWMRWERRVALHDVCFSVNEGDFVAITGPNGGGKTTMLRIILQLLKPTEGRVILRDNNREVKALPIGYLPQRNMIDSRFPINVEAVVASGLIAKKGITKEERRERVGETIGLMGLEAHARCPIGDLSGGQLQRALLGRAIISRPRILVLDEPLSYVDKRFEHKMYEIVESLSRHTTILLVSHEMSMISGMANRHVIVDGSLHECSAAHHYVKTGCDM